MPLEPAPTPKASGNVDAATLRAFSAVGASAYALKALALWMVPPLAARYGSVWMIGPCVLLALLFASAAWCAARWPARRVLLVLAWLSCANIVNVAFGQGRGMQALELGFFGLLCCCVAIWLGRRQAAALALACAVALVGIGWASGLERNLLPLLTQLLLLGCGLGVGLIAAAAALRAARRVEDREQRLRSLLDMAADRYWEMDADLRLSNAGWVDAPGEGSMAAYVGHDPMDQGDLKFEPGVKEAHMADLKERRPFRDVRFSRRGPDGKVTHYALSGRPRFAADGSFIGYWGIGRNVTFEAEARQTIAASESRFRDLFRQAPSALVLHRQGVILDANPAAAAMFDFGSAAAMRGVALDSLYADADSLARVRERIARLELAPVGSSVPTADFRMRSVKGQTLTTQASGVRVEAEGGAATLSMYVDITARVNGEAALRESQRVLETLFSNNPDGIALTVMETGRYVIVNENFARLLGYRVDEVIGRTSAEIGLWTHPEQRATLLAEVLAHGRLAETTGKVNTRSGQRMSVIWSASRVEINGRAHLISNLRDVTEAERLRLEHGAVFHSAIVGIALTRDQHFQLANPRFHDIFGWPAGALIGQPALCVWPDAQAYAEARGVGLPLLQQGRPFRLERPMQRADGSRFWCRLQAQVVDPANPIAGGTVWVVEDITERRQLDENLAAARDAALAASRAKSSFLANTSHEIRTPLNGMLGLARMAAHDELAPALRRQYLAQLVDSAQNLAGIISDILDLSKIEAGRVEVDTAPFDLRELLAAMLGSYRPAADAAGLALTLAIDDAVPAGVRGDALRVRQILGNFITNALKFTAEGSVGIEVRALGEGRLRLAVTDTGPGIDAEVQRRLFTPFTQGDDSTTRRYGGTGLGLSICRELATLLGGTVGVDSAPGHGSVFWAELPLPAADALPAVAADAAPDALAGLRVLVVEDNAVNMMIAVAMLGQWGAETSEAVDGAQAIAAVGEAAAAGRPFDVVLMDVQMPRMSGHDASRRLRRQWDAKALPIVALTAAALVAEREEALAAGMNEFLTKPIDANRLLDTLRRVAVRREPV